MGKGIINAFDRMELCFVINLTKNGKWAITPPPIFATGYVSFATTFLYQEASTCYLQKKLISNTVLVSCIYLDATSSSNDTSTPLVRRGLPFSY